ncbi:MAG: TetR/AcrR family transcriptional regulator, partial [Roseicyclus sp.]
MPKIVDRDAMRTAILDAAVKTFARKGYNAATIADLAAAAGLGKGTLYLYFTSKAAVAEAVIDRYFRRMAERLRAEARPPSLRAFLDGLRGAMEVPEDEAALIRVFFEVYGPGLASGDVARRLSRHFDDLGNHYASALTHLLAVGEVRPDLDTRSAGRALASLVDGMVLHGALFNASPLVGPGLRSEALDIFLRGLRP